MVIAASIIQTEGEMYPFIYPHFPFKADGISSNPVAYLFSPFKSAQS
ncbi:hypothetical protein X975_08500, partial [Stegodyphus mimosarum]